MSVTIIDLGYGNLGSIRAAFARLGAETEQTSRPTKIASAERLVLPGVGSAGFAMERLRSLGLEAVLRSFHRPVLGICLGMQLLFDWSEEDSTNCLGLIKGNVRRLKPSPDRPVPHMGWSRLRVDRQDRGLEEGDYVWFAHGFACNAGPHVFAFADYGRSIPVAVERDHLLGCQFHPERSSEAGANFLKGFLGR